MTSLVYRALAALVPRDRYELPSRSRPTHPHDVGLGAHVRFLARRMAWSPGEIGRPALDSLRMPLGLAPDPQLTMLCRYLYLAFLPPTLAPALWLPISRYRAEPGLEQPC